jgi:polyhydroxyalkanoate synthesis regulator protein
MTVTALDNAALDRIAIENDAKQGERMLSELHKFLARFVSFSGVG